VSGQPDDSRQLGSGPTHMTRLRVLCWVWIVAATILILLSAPVSVTRPGYGGDKLTTIEWIGPFKEPYKSHRVTRSSIDFSRLLVALLAVNFLPALILWRHDEIIRSWERRERQAVTSEKPPNSEMLALARAQREISGARR
jgi:hypothetical protein